VSIKKNKWYGHKIGCIWYCEDKNEISINTHRNYTRLENLHWEVRSRYSAQSIFVKAAAPNSTLMALKRPNPVTSLTITKSWICFCRPKQWSHLIASDIYQKQKHFSIERLLLQKQSNRLLNLSIQLRNDSDH
jgi:hypothetical protein